jgi:hypothetical protein
MFSIPFTNLVIVPRDDVRPKQEWLEFSLDAWMADARRRYGWDSVTAQTAPERAKAATKRHINASRKAVTEGSTNRCAHCGKKVSQRARYCKGSRCRTAAYRARLRNQ